MGDGTHRPAAPNIRLIALYPVRLGTLHGCPGVRFRSRRKAEWTMVPCRVDAMDGRSVAVPALPIPEGTPKPFYRAQLETFRAPVTDRKLLCVVLSGEPGARKMDPEQILLSPIFDDGHRMIYEFRRAHILTVTSRGDVETRFVAVDPVRGIVGTKAIHRFDTKLLALTARCVDHLAGLVDLFPAPDRVGYARRPPVPSGEADLILGPSRRPTLNSQKESQSRD